MSETLTNPLVDVAIYDDGFLRFVATADGKKVTLEFNDPNGAMKDSYALAIGAEAIGILKEHGFEAACEFFNSYAEDKEGMSLDEFLESL